MVYDAVTHEETREENISLSSLSLSEENKRERKQNLSASLDSPSLCRTEEKKRREEKTLPNNSSIPRVDADRMLSLLISLHLFIVIRSTQSLETIQVTLASTVELPCSISHSNDSNHPAKVTRRRRKHPEQCSSKGNVSETRRYHLTMTSCLAAGGSLTSGAAGGGQIALEMFFFSI